MFLKDYFAKLVVVFALLCLPFAGRAQQVQPQALDRILQRLDALEQQNEALLQQIKDLRQELKDAHATAASQAAADETEDTREKVDVNTRRIEEQAQTKVEAFQRFPLSVTGMFLFDASYLSPNTSQLLQLYNGDPSSGAGLQQSIIGLQFRGPQLPGGGQVHGEIQADFYGRIYGNYTFRIRRGMVTMDWRSTSLFFGQDKPIVAPLQPTSFARVGVPPLADAGNLWLWLPQVRFEQRFATSANTKVTVQAAAVETDESYVLSVLPANTYGDAHRPGGEVRLAFTHAKDGTTDFSAGLGFHASSSHILDQSLKSRVLSADFLYKALPKVELSGTVFRGENFAGLGGTPGGITTTAQGLLLPVHATAGWLQLAFPLTSRLTLDVYAGRQFNRPADLIANEPARTLSYAGNVLYRISPNVVLGFEASREDLVLFNSRQLATNRYDATAAYLF